MPISPIIFDLPRVAALGCNSHDWMTGLFVADMRDHAGVGVGASDTRGVDSGAASPSAGPARALPR